MVVVEGQCVLPPVCVDTPEHDLGICVPDRVYRQQIQVMSSSTLTRTLQVVSPEAEVGALWVEPACSFVQPRGLASLTANLCLSFSFFQRHPEYVCPLPPGIAKLHPKSIAFKIPIRIKASDQILRAETAVTGKQRTHYIHLRFCFWDSPICRYNAAHRECGPLSPLPLVIPPRSQPYISAVRSNRVEAYDCPCRPCISF